MKKGFTLIELLAVITILAVISVIAYPKVIDTIGAGDSHIGAIIASLSKGLSLHESIEVANLVASSIVQVEGPVMDLYTFNNIVKGEIKDEYAKKIF